MIEKTTAIVAAAVCASFITIFIPGFAPATAAGAPNSTALAAAAATVSPAVTRTAAIAQVGPNACTQAWPYYDASCLHDDRQPDGKARTVRIVSLDRVASIGVQPGAR